MDFQLPTEAMLAVGIEAARFFCAFRSAACLTHRVLNPMLEEPQEALDSLLNHRKRF